MRERPTSPTVLWLAITRGSAIRRQMELLRYEMTTERKLGNLYGYNGGNFAGNIYDKRGLCPALLTMQGGG